MIRYFVIATMVLFPSLTHAAISFPNLLNSGSKDMTLDGSSVNKTFSYSAGGSTAEVQSITVLLKDEGTTAYGNFGAISALTNGILLKSVNSNGDADIATLKDNGDLTTRFNRSHFGSSAVLSILSVVTPQGFGNTTNSFIGTMEVTPESLILTGTDTLEAIVRDNLSNVDVLEMAVKVRVQ